MPYFPALRDRAELVAFIDATRRSVGSPFVTDAERAERDAYALDVALAFLKQQADTIRDLTPSPEPAPYVRFDGYRADMRST